MAEGTGTAITVRGRRDGTPTGTGVTITGTATGIVVGVKIPASVTVTDVIIAVLHRTVTVAATIRVVTTRGLLRRRRSLPMIRLLSLQQLHALNAHSLVVFLELAWQLVTAF